MCEITSKVQCQDCLLNWEIGIVSCPCAVNACNLHKKNRKLNKDRNDVLPIPNYVTKKGPSHGARHGPAERQRIYHKAHNTLRKAKNPGHIIILDRFLSSPRHRDSQTKIGGMRIFVLLMTRSHQRSILTLRRDGNEAETKARGSSCWTLKVQIDPWINAMTTKKQRKTCDRLHRKKTAAAAYVSTRIHPWDQVRRRPKQQFEGHEEDSCRIDSEKGWKYYLVATTTSSSSSSLRRPSDSRRTAWNWDSSSWIEQ